MEDCIFCDIVAGETETTFSLEREHVVAFPDINPVAPLHILIVSRRHIPSAHQLGSDHSDLLTDISAAADHLIAQTEFETYRLVSNVGASGGQAIPHLHFHVLAGREFGDPTGLSS